MGAGGLGEARRVPGASHGDAITALSAVELGAGSGSCAVFSVSRDARIKRTVISGAGFLVDEFPRELGKSHSRAITSVCALTDNATSEVRVFTGGVDRAVLMWRASMGQAPEVLSGKPPPEPLSDFRAAAAEQVPKNKAADPGPRMIGEGREGVGWGENLVAQEVVAVRVFACSGASFCATAYADGTVVTRIISPELAELGDIARDPDLGREAVMSFPGRGRNDGGEPVRLTAFEVWEVERRPRDTPKILMPHFLVGYSDGTVEIKAIGSMHEPDSPCKVVLTPAETAYAGPVMPFGGGGAIKGKRGHAVTSLAGLGPVYSMDTGGGSSVLAANFAVGCTLKEEGGGWYSVFTYLPYA
jgi:hypothetical protein